MPRHDREPPYLDLTLLGHVRFSRRTDGSVRVIGAGRRRSPAAHACPIYQWEALVSAEALAAARLRLDDGAPPRPKPRRR